MGSMPVAAGMDAMEEGPPAGTQFEMPQAPMDTSGDTHMQAASLPAMSVPTLEGFGVSAYSPTTDIGTSSPAHQESPVGSMDAAKGTPATASGSGGGLTTAPTTGGY